MESFDRLLSECRGSVESYVRYRLPSWADADDVVQEVCLRALLRFDQLRSDDGFRAWIIAIARNACSDWFRSRARESCIPLETVADRIMTRGRFGIAETTVVRDTLDRLCERDRSILWMSYFLELPQREIAERLGIPVGTVKSRLFSAKASFRSLYPREMRGEFSMKANESITRLPEFLPEYSIKQIDAEPFEVVCEELPGWVLPARLGEKLSWGLYELPSRRRTEFTDMEVVGKCEVHGIIGLEVVAHQHDAEDYFRTGSIDEIERRFAVQLTDSHVRFLAESHSEDGGRRCFTFLDGASFLDNWGYGENNCGAETRLAPRGRLVREGDRIERVGSGTAVNPISRDIVGRYLVKIGEKEYDTVCLIDAECFDDSIASEQFIDKNGRTVLWRRFNRDDWAMHRYGRRWSELLPDNERLTIDGEIFVHWYDCVSDYIF